MTETTKKLIKLFKDWSNQDAESIQPIIQSGSDRKYFRISGNKKNCHWSF